VAVDGAGNVYVTDRHAIRRITNGGVVTTLAGSMSSFGSTDGSGGVARFRDPLGIAIDPAGNLVVADTENQTIRKITSAGVVSTFAGSAGSAGFTDATGSAARFKFPTGLAFDAAGNLYVSDMFNHVIRKITSSGVVTTLAGSPGTSGTADGTGDTARFKFPRGLTVDAAGTVFVTDSGNNTIRRITSTGVVTTLAGDSTLGAYVDGVGTAAKFLSPRGIVVEADGSLLVTDNGNHLIRKVAPNRAVTTFAGIPDARGSADGIGSDAQFNLPRDVAVTNTGVVYVSDANNHTIRKIAPGGEVTLFAGAAGIPGWTDGAAATARFFNPAGLATDAAGNLYVADRSSHTIRKISPQRVRHDDRRPRLPIRRDRRTSERGPIQHSHPGRRGQCGQRLCFRHRQLYHPKNHSRRNSHHAGRHRGRVGAFGRRWPARPLPFTSRTGRRRGGYSVRDGQPQRHRAEDLAHRSGLHRGRRPPVNR
jgi:sugar lactone lactonase YvrE